MSDDEIRRRLAESFSTDDRHEPTAQGYAEADRLLAARDARQAHELAEKQRKAIKGFDLDDHWAVFYRVSDVEALPDLIDPEEER